jgi:hypothetical protein
MALLNPIPINSEAGPSSPPSTSPRQSKSLELELELPSLQPLSHTNAFLSASSFDPDAFLLTRAHIPLEELRGELREYLGQLREELVQLINDDYEEFISLGTGLRGEEERLIRLGKPLGQLSEEVESVRGMLLEQQIEVQDKLDQRAALREEKVSPRNAEVKWADDRLYWIYFNDCLMLYLVRKRCWRIQKRRIEQN